MTLKQRLTEDMKSSMRSGDKPRLGVIRLVLSAIKQREVDERIELTDTDVLGVLEKMLKQRRDSASQYEAAGRQDLMDQEKYEIGVVAEYLPQPLSDAEVDQILDDCIAESGAVEARDMGKVMALLKPRVAGRADMQSLAAKVKAKLG